MNTREATVMMIRSPSPPFQTVQLHRMRKEFRQIDETAYFYPGKKPPAMQVE